MLASIPIIHVVMLTLVGVDVLYALYDLIICGIRLNVNSTR